MVLKNKNNDPDKGENMNKNLDHNDRNGGVVMIILKACS